MLYLWYISLLFLLRILVFIIFKFSKISKLSEILTVPNYEILSGTQSDSIFLGSRTSLEIVQSKYAYVNRVSVACPGDFLHVHQVFQFDQRNMNWIVF